VDLTAQSASSLRRDIRESQDRLEEIRAERARLQREMESLRSRVRNVSSELRNIERQLSASRTVLAEIDFQLVGTSARVQQTTEDLIQNREELRQREAILMRRLRDIYKRGPLHTAQVLLGADSFSDLLNRYRYLQLITSYDRSLVQQVRDLEQALIGQNRELQESLSELGRLRQEQLTELAELQLVERDRQRTLATFRSREQQAQSELQQLEEDERRLTELVEDLERRRLELERRRAVAGRPDEPSTITGDDAGSLDWPVDGRVLYRFGRDQRPDGRVLRWNGVGIAAPAGTPVHAVASGTVALAGPFEGYGPTVVVSHGGGFYTLYLYLDEIEVVEGRSVSAGQTLGTVGGSETPEGPHIEFQIRAPVDGGSPRAMDPSQWLRPPGGGG
jgi:septal ring factor EnvC (AmiA/AmiB activator)